MSQLDLLARLARIATADLELRPMLQRITDALAELFEWDFVALARIERERGRCVCEAVTSRVPTAIGPGYSRPLGDGVVGLVAASGAPVLLDDTATFPGFVDTLPGARSELCVPIRHAGEVVAVLNLESPRPAAFHGQLPLVEAIAGQIAGAIASARHLEEVRARAATFAALSDVSRAALQAPGLDEALASIAEFLQRRFDFFLVAMVVADEGAREWRHRAFASRTPLELRVPASWPVERGVVGRALRHGTTQLVENVRRDPDYFAVHDAVVAELVVPIRWGSRTLGALNVESDAPGVFPPATRQLLELVAEQVAGAIQLALANRNLSATKEQLERANAQLEHLSLLDPLTGVANRRRFDAALELEWRRLLRSGQPLALLLLDIDWFKAFNDGRGHLAGDRVLQRVGALLQASLRRAGDLVARYGGEEFAILLAETGVAGAGAVAERLRGEIEALAIPHPASTTAPVLTASLGVAARVPQLEICPTSLIAAADEALYRAKGTGRNRVAVSRDPE